MIRKHFRTRVELERQIDVARQLRAGARAGAGWIFSAVAGALWVIRRRVLRIIASAASALNPNRRLGLPARADRIPAAPRRIFNDCD